MIQNRKKPEKLNKDLASPQFWQKVWRQVYEQSPLQSIAANRQAWVSFWNEVSNIYSQLATYTWTLGEVVAEFFFSEKIIKVGSRILDVSSGNGNMAIPLAARGAKVVAMDPAPNMLHILITTARQRGLLPNIHPVCQAFENAHFRETFDLVLASFSPAIVDAPTLLRFEKLSHNYCALIGPAQANMLNWRNSLWGHIMKKPPATFPFPALLPFNLLYTLERVPNLKQFSISAEQPAIDIVSKFYSRYFALFGKNQKDIENYILSSPASAETPNQKLPNNLHKIALIYWNSNDSKKRV
jgi:SAM-dependent methyltransferase